MYIFSAPPIGAAHPGPTGNAEAILMIDDNEPLNAYANSAAAIGLRISANLRGGLTSSSYKSLTRVWA
jgi:hypothetical protein